MENCYILVVREHGNQKTDTNIYYSIILYLSANIEKKLLVSKQISDDIKQFSYEICQRHKVIYFACSVGNVSEEILKKYIEAQG